VVIFIEKYYTNMGKKSQLTQLSDKSIPITLLSLRPPPSFTAHTVLELVLLKLLNWSWSSAFLAILFARLEILLFLFVGIHEGLGVSEEIAETRIILMIHHRWCCSHMEQP
jgi:hypothetical protein